MTNLNRRCWVRSWFKRGLIAVSLTTIFAAATVGGMLFYEQYRLHTGIKEARYHQETLFAPVVRLVCEYNTPYGKKKNRGSGVVVYSKPNENGSGYDTYVLTANHVVQTPVYSWKKLGGNPEGSGMYYDMTPIGFRRSVTYVEYFHTATGKSIKVPAHVVAYSPNVIFGKDKDGNFEPKEKHWSGKKGGEDLALLRLETTEQFHAAKMPLPERVESLKVLDEVRLVGCALADKPIQTSGEITRLERGYMQVDAPIIFGNSGGACFLKGTHELIGIANAVRATNTPMGPRVPVTHMGLVRPIKRIYRWLDREKYTFIYDETVSDAERFEKLRRDKYERVFDLKKREEKLIRGLKKQLERYEEQNKALERRIEELMPKYEMWEPKCEPRCEPECEPEYDED